MLVKACLADEIYEEFTDMYVKLLEKGVSSSDILVICPRPAQKFNFIEKVKEKNKIGIFEKLNIHTFFGLCYNTVKDNFSLLQDNLLTDDLHLQPNLCGLEVSGFIFKKCLHSDYFKDYNSKKNLLHQLFKRHSLIVQNGLSEQEVEEKSKILNETFADDAKCVLDEFNAETNSFCSFDYIRQITLFSYLFKNFEVFKNIKYLFLPDADEAPPVLFDFVKTIADNLDDYFISYDELGSSRCGYLCATTNAGERLSQIFGVEAKEFKSSKKSVIAEFERDKKIELPFVYSSKYLDMLDCAFDKVKELLKAKTPPNDIVIVTPCINDMLKFYAQENFLRYGIKYKVLSGSEKLSENNFVKNIFLLLKLKFFKTQFTPDEFDVRNFYNFVLKIPLKYTRELDVEFLSKLKSKNFYSEFLEFINTIEQEESPLSRKIIAVAERIIGFDFECTKTDLQKYTFLVKEVSDFENCFPEQGFNEEFQIKIIQQLENTIIAENPPGEGALEQEENSIFFATPQKVIDLGKKVKHQIWLDASDDEWKKQDLGMLYNSWVFQKNWHTEKFDCEINNKLTNEKCFRTLRKLLLLSENVSVYASVFNSCGMENYEGILNFIKSEENPKEEKSFKFIPRDDQKEVLNYESGKLAIAAVPGAGKTTVLQALIEKLLEDKVPAENIFVLTYMESAATNFKERIKTTLKHSVEIPNISTIHGLALRIIKENGNYTRVGLDEDFEIIDEIARTNLIKRIFEKYQIPSGNLEKYERALSIYKLGVDLNLDNTGNDIPMKNFTNFAAFYNKKLLENNKIDYDDMLCYALKILEENPDILEYYQNICKYIIEDEAQDSSKIQQKLLTMLSGKYKNYIRCGDLNQAITATFTNADIEGFREFVKQNKCVEMNRSQRCAKDIYSLANKLVKYSAQSEDLKDSFYSIEMQGVDGKNPTVPNSVKYKLFENSGVENQAVLKEVKEIFQKEPNATIGLLVRNNAQVTKWSEFFEQNNIPFKSGSGTLSQMPIFKLIFSILQIILNPFDNNLFKEAFTLLKPKNQNREFWNNLKIPFIKINPDEITDNELLDFWWDINYWLGLSNLRLSELAQKIGIYYFKTPTEKSNVYLLCALIQKIKNSVTTKRDILARLEDLSKRSSLGGIKFFELSYEDEANNPDNQLPSKVQIMTIHKSKGAEFDYVFLPQMSSKAIALHIENSKIKGENIFLENVKALSRSYEKKSNEEILKSQLEENARLLYVAITRAKRRLYFSCANEYKFFSSVKKSVPCDFLVDNFETGGAKNAQE